MYSSNYEMEVGYPGIAIQGNRVGLIVIKRLINSSENMRETHVSDLLKSSLQ